MNDEWTRGQAEKGLAQMTEWIGRHDTRSAGATGITVAMIGALSTVVPPFKAWTLSFSVALAVTGIGFAYVLYQLLSGQAPRIRRGARSFMFFGSIATMSREEFRSGFVARTEQDYLDDLLAQIHVNARIVRSKFRCLRRALIGLLATTIPWSISIAYSRAL